MVIKMKKEEKEINIGPATVIGATLGAMAGGWAGAIVGGIIGYLVDEESKKER